MKKVNIVEVFRAAGVYVKAGSQPKNVDITLKSQSSRLATAEGIPKNTLPELGYMVDEVVAKAMTRRVADNEKSQYYTQAEALLKNWDKIVAGVDHTPIEQKVKVNAFRAAKAIDAIKVLIESIKDDSDVTELKLQLIDIVAETEENHE